VVEGGSTDRQIALENNEMLRSLIEKVQGIEVKQEESIAIIKQNKKAEVHHHQIFNTEPDMPNQDDQPHE